VHIDRKDLDRAAAAGLLSREQAAALWDDLARRGAPDPAPPAQGAHPRDAAVAVAGLAGAAVAAWLLLLVWERFGAGGGFALAAIYGGLLARGAFWLVRRAHPTAASVLASAAVAMAPVAVHALQDWTGVGADRGAAPDTLAGWVGSHGFPAAFAAVVAALLALRALALPALSAVSVAAAWFLAQDGAPLAFGPSPTWNERALLSSLFGALALATGLLVDGRTRRDHSRWIYLAGLVAFWGGLTTYHSGSSASLAVGAYVNGALVAAALLLRRRAFAVFGLVGLAGVAGRLANDALDDAVVPFAFAAIGLAAAAAAVVYRRYEDVWSRAVLARFPETLRRLLPPLAPRR
jgi:hypothetical protein